MEALILPLVHAMLGPILDDGLKAFEAYNNKQISLAELQERLKEMQLKAATDWLKSSNDSTIKIFDSFQQTLRVNATAQLIWKYFMASQIAFLVWLEMGVPLMYKLGFGGWPVGSLDTWAMGAILGGLGIGKIINTVPKLPT